MLPAGPIKGNASYVRRFSRTLQVAFLLAFFGGLAFFMREGLVVRRELAHFLRGKKIAVRGRKVSPSQIKWEEHNPSADVVVAVGSGYQPRVWHLFVGSLRRTGFTGDIVVGVNRDDLAQAEIVDFAKSQGVILYEISAVCGDGKAARKTSCSLHKFYEDEEGEDRSGQPISNLRYELLNAWSQIYDDDSIIFSTDFRDVFFQENPFPLLRAALQKGGGGGGAAPSFIAFEEAKELTIGMEGNGNSWNTRWIRKCYGPQAVAQLAGQNVLCSGTSAGTARSMSRYFDAMLQELQSLDCGSIGGADQGVHNYLIRGSGLVFKDGEVSIQERGMGVVNTLSALVRLRGPLSGLGLRDSDGYVLNNDGARSAIVHQYDRDEGLKNWARTTLTRSMLAHARKAPTV